MNDDSGLCDGLLKATTKREEIIKSHIKQRWTERTYALAQGA